MVFAVSLGGARCPLKEGPLDRPREASKGLLRHDFVEFGGGVK